MNIRHLIGLSGPAGCGKSSAAAWMEAQHGFFHYAMAGPIYDGIGAMFRLRADDLERPNKERELDWLGCSPRALLQTLGTEWGRDVVGEDVWIKVAERRLDVAFREHVVKSMGSPFNVVVEDVRFENEARWIRGLGGQLVWIDRPDISLVRGHISESAIDYSLVDLELDNSGSLVDFKRGLDRLNDWLGSGWHG